MGDDAEKKKEASLYLSRLLGVLLHNIMKANPPDDPDIEGLKEEVEKVMAPLDEKRAGDVEVIQATFQEKFLEKRFDKALGLPLYKSTAALIQSAINLAKTQLNPDHHIPLPRDAIANLSDLLDDPTYSKEIREPLYCSWAQAAEWNALIQEWCPFQGQTIDDDDDVKVSKRPLSPK